MRKASGYALQGNIISNIVARSWSMVSIYLFIPLYISYLGQDAYGLVTFFSTLQAMMGLFGAGLSKTLRREFSQGINDDDLKQKKYKLLRSIEMVYILVFFIVQLLCFSTAGFIAINWLHTNSLEPTLVITTIKLMGVSIGLQMVSSVYFGGLMGLDHQILANTDQVIWSLFKNGGAALILAYLDGGLQAFYLWYILCDAVYLLVLRGQTIAQLRGDFRFQWNVRDLDNLIPIWKFAFGLFVVSIVAMINTQVDKVIISKELPLSSLGAYNLAYSLGNISVVIATAISIALFTRFSTLYGLKQKEELHQLFLSSNRRVSLLISSVGVYIAFYAHDLLFFWSRNKEMSDSAAPVAFFVALGCCFLALQVIPYEFLLSYGNTKINNILGVINIIMVIIFTPLMIRQFGMIGAGITYFFIMFITTIFYLFIIHRLYFNRGAFCWLLFDELLPFLMMMIFAVFSKVGMKALEISGVWVVVFAIFCGGLSLLISVFIFDRGLYLEFFKRALRREV